MNVESTGNCNGGKCPRRDQSTEPVASDVRVVYLRGDIAYNGYRAAVGRRSFVDVAAIPLWSELDSETQQAWHDAATDVILDERTRQEKRGGAQ